MYDTYMYVIYEYKEHKKPAGCKNLAKLHKKCKKSLPQAKKIKIADVRIWLTPPPLSAVSAFG